MIKERKKKVLMRKREKVSGKKHELIGEGGETER